MNITNGFVWRENDIAAGGTRTHIGGNLGSQPGVKSACMRQLVRLRGAVVAFAGVWNKGDV